jgi:uncharacterized protein (TIGR02757 family)
MKHFLDEKFHLFCLNEFVADDPISIPHKFSKKQDIEIAAFWTAMISWGNRKSIMSSANKLLQFMDNSPHEFVLDHTPKELKKFETFVHRTFQPIDALGFIHFFKSHYQKHESLESAFLSGDQFVDVKTSLINFQSTMFDDSDAIALRTKKHIASPINKSTCKRMNMFLRWMVRSNKEGVDFGLWQKIPSSALMMPLDVHVERVARHLGLIERKQSDWQTVEELTGNLRLFDSNDPVKYDFALFGMGVSKYYTTVI